MVIGSLPAGWTSTTLDDSCLVIQGQSPPSATYNTDGVGLPFLQGKAEFGSMYPQAVKHCSAPSKIAEPGDVLISIRAPVGPTNLCAAQSCIGRGLAAIRTEGGIPSKYIFYAMRATEEELRAKSTGTTFEAIRGDDLRSHPLPLPPLPEQHRIVAEIEKHFTRLDASVAALKRVQANLRRYRASVLKSACEGKLVPTEAELTRSEDRDYEPADRLLDRILSQRRAQWESQEKRRGKYKEPTPPDTSNLSELPEGWAWAGLDQLAIIIRNGYSKRPRGDTGTPILRISAVRPLSVNLSDIRWVDSKDDLAGFLIHSGDLLFTRYNGNTELVGVCGVVPALDRETLHPDKLIRACLTKYGALPNFVQIVANSGVSRKFLERRIRTTAGQSGISGSDLKSMPIPLPPLAEQHRIVAEVERRLSVIQQAESAVEASMIRAERLRQSILKQAFSGKLVPQDPNDEPASVLLERIRAERAAAEEAAKSQRKPRRRRSKSAPAKRPKLSEAAT